MSKQLIENAQDNLDPDRKKLAEQYLFVLQAATANQSNFSYNSDCVL